MKTFTLLINGRDLDTKLYEYVQKKRIPTYKIGRTWHFKMSKIDAWLEKQEKSKS